MKKFSIVAMFTLLAATVSAQEISPLLEDLNGQIASQGLNLQIQKMEYIVEFDANGDQMGRTVFADDRTKLLASQWVEADARRLNDGNNLTYLVDPRFVLANGAIDSEPSIDASFETWNNVNCSKLNLVKRPWPGVETNFVLGLFFGFPADPFAADITTTGFLPGFVFDLLAPNGSQSILGVTFTLIFVDGNGDPTDLNGDGRNDTALKEVWYNDAFLWSTDGSPGIDLESVAVHENGHALGFDHFGTIFVNEGGLHVASDSVMLASYLGPQRTLLGTDNASMCSVYANWPNK